MNFDIIANSIFDNIFILILSFIVLAKAADYLVDEAVKLATLMKLSPLIIGATIISLGTTLPEVVVSVNASLIGNPSIALGNSIGSVICDTALILGLASLIGRIPLTDKVLNKQAWIQLSSGILIALVLFYFGSGLESFKSGSYLPQYIGWLFIALLALYLFYSTKWTNSEDLKEEVSQDSSSGKSKFIFWSLTKIILMITLIVISSHILINSIIIIAKEMGVSESFLALSAVALGTSLPELVTAITAVKKGHGEVALGNVIGADILNILLVTGMATSVSPVGLEASKDFFIFPIPIMLISLILLRIGLWRSKENLEKKYGVGLLSLYLLFLAFTYNSL